MIRFFSGFYISTCTLLPFRNGLRLFWVRSIGLFTKTHRWARLRWFAQANIWKKIIKHTKVLNKYHRWNLTWKAWCSWKLTKNTVSTDTEHIWDTRSWYEYIYSTPFILHTLHCVEKKYDIHQRSTIAESAFLFHAIFLAKFEFSVCF